MTLLMLFHVSEEDGIERFEPRWSEIRNRKAVWASDAERPKYKVRAPTARNVIARGKREARRPWLRKKHEIEV
jgi:hypothetical protein